MSPAPPRATNSQRVFRFSSNIFTSFQNVSTWRSAPYNLKWDCTLYAKLRKSIPGWRGWVQRTTRLTSHQHRPNPGLGPGGWWFWGWSYTDLHCLFPLRLDLFFFSESQRMGNCSYKYIFLKAEKEKKSAHQATIAIESDPTEWLLVNWRESHIAKEKKCVNQKRDSSAMDTKGKETHKDMCEKKVFYQWPCIWPVSCLPWLSPMLTKHFGDNVACLEGKSRLLRPSWM